MRGEIQKLQRETDQLQQRIEAEFFRDKAIQTKIAKRNRLRRLIEEQEQSISTSISINQVGK